MKMTHFLQKPSIPYADTTFSLFIILLARCEEITCFLSFAIGIVIHTCLFGLNCVSSLPNSYVKILTPNMTILEGRTHKEASKVK